MRRTRGAAIIVLKCVVIGLGANAQQAVFSAEVGSPSKPTAHAAKESIDRNVVLQSLIVQLPEGDQVSLSPPLLLQPGLVASASQAGGYISEAGETKDTEVPVELPAVAQETKDVNAPTEPQSVMREIKSATRLSSSKQRRRKPKMAGIPAGSQTMAQETRESESQVAGKEIKPPKMAGIPASLQTIAPEIKGSESKIVEKETRKPKMAGIPASSQTVVQETRESESQAVVQEAKKPEPQAVAQETRESESQVVQKTKKPESQMAQEDEETGASDKLLPEPQETKKIATLSELGTKVQEPDAASRKKKKYAMAPIKWSARLSQTVARGSVTTTYHIANPDAAAAALYSGTTHTGYLINTQTAEVMANSYILQPYIASLAGDLGVVSNKSGSVLTSISPGAINSIHDTSTRNNRLFGKGKLSVYQQSRFPFMLSFESSSDKSVEAQFTPDTVVRKSLRLDQSYRALNSPSSYQGNYRRETVDNISATSFQSSWQGNYATRNTEHRIAATTRLREKLINVNKSNGSSFNTSTNDFTLSDAYLPTDSLWSFNSFGNLNLFTDASNNNSTRYLLANTNIGWQPEAEDVPLFVNGSAFLVDQLQTTPTSGYRSRTLGATVVANYLFSDILRGNASGNATMESNGGNRRMMTNQVGTVTYAPAGVRLWKDSTYGWGTHGSIFTGTGDPTTDRGVSGGANQSLSVPYPLNILGKKLRASSGINQSLEANISRIAGQKITLTNAGRVSLAVPSVFLKDKKVELLGGRGGWSGGTGTSVDLSLNDVRTFGKKPEHSRNLALSLNLNERGNTMFERAGLTIEAGVQSYQGTVAGGTTGSGPRGSIQGVNTKLVGVGSATYRYSKSRVFNVRGLDYSGSAKVKRETSYMRDNISSRTIQYTEGPAFPWMVNQSLIYRIGQNELSLTQSLGDESGVKSASLWILFRAWRTMGN